MVAFADARQGRSEYAVALLLQGGAHAGIAPAAMPGPVDENERAHRRLREVGTGGLYASAWRLHRKGYLRALRTTSLFAWLPAAGNHAERSPSRTSPERPHPPRVSPSRGKVKLRWRARARCNAYRPL